ncbi:hypothetical protein, partial [Clostridium beijerinckii]|uniref:hypothetical protein n=1 Tax=Clostridium beijerinckii TaxID=1520 RepID=UPI001A9B5BA7
CIAGTIKSINNVFATSNQSLFIFINEFRNYLFFNKFSHSSLTNTPRGASEVGRAEVANNILPSESNI